ncbi:hypothetical protein HHI36_019674 [Cryptolaemus montrouzieri]|uniref:BTB domain-containing protein n=1 Tax=Cryptolaemus montrouzieri TaxID=559131 RepID=A0ABD2N831_9CUCU
MNMIWVNRPAARSNLPQFVKLSDLECQKTRLDLSLTPRLSRSIPESSWVESPLLMSRSAGYRSAPRPMEPENEEMYNSFSTTETCSSQPRKSVRRLGTDLLRMFLEEIGPDVTIEVENHKIKAHKCILASRCQYFAALLSGNWLEASGNVISLEGFSYESVYFSLCHIYSGAAHVPDSISVIELASLADMLGLEGLKEVVEHALKQRYCHNFHKPCAGCCTGVTEVLMLSAAYGLDDLYQKCLQWITQNFVKIWPSRGFSSLPRELREKCYQQHVVHMSPDRVLETKAACEKILSMLPSNRWAEPIQQLSQQLIDACHLYHRQHYAAVLVSPSFIALDSGPGWCVLQIEDQMVSTASNLGVEQACRSYSRCCKMLEQAWSRSFEDLLNKIKSTLEQCLVSQADRLIRSNAWLRLDSPLRARIKDLTPTGESSSRLPRANPKKFRTNNSQSTQSSSDSSRNSSPGMNQNRLLNSSGSPSLRKSLLLAAKAPQVPPSPTITRKSTLTQPTAASAAKSTPSKSTKFPSKIQPPKNTFQPKVSFQIKDKYSEVKTANLKREAPKKHEKLSHSPLKTDSRSSSPGKFDSRLGSPVKIVLRASSPLKMDIRASSPKKPYTSDRVIQNNATKANDIKKQPAKPTAVKKNPSDSQIRPRTNLITQQRMLKHAANAEKSKPAAPRMTRTRTNNTSGNHHSSTLKKNKSSNDVLQIKTKSSNSNISVSPDNENFRYSPEGMISSEDGHLRTYSSKTISESTEASVCLKIDRRDSESRSNSESETFIKKYPAMQRSDTFLKEEPTVIGKLK